MVRTRLTADNIGRYKGVSDTFVKMVRYEGVRGLWQGLLPAVATIIPEAAITYGMLDTMKRRHARVTGRAAGVLPALGYGVASAFMGQVWINVLLLVGCQTVWGQSLVDIAMFSLLPRW